MLSLPMSTAGRISSNMVASSYFSSNRRLSSGGVGVPSSLSIIRPIDECKKSVVFHRSSASDIVRKSSPDHNSNNNNNNNVEATSPSLAYPYPLFLVHPRYNNNNKNKQVFCFYDVEKHDLYITSNIIPTEISTCVCCGSTPYGWLVYISYIDCSMYLWNPSSPSSIQSLYKLPPITTLPHIFNSTPENPSETGGSTMSFEFRISEDCGARLGGDAYTVSLELMEKVVLSGPPVNDDCIVVALNGMGYNERDEGNLHVSYCKPGDRKWITIKSLTYQPFRDILHFKDKLFYILEESGNLVSLDLHDLSSPKITVIKASLQKKEWGSYVDTRPQFYLVASQGDLFCVSRYCEFGYFDEDHNFVHGYHGIHGRYTLEVEVYKFDFLKSQWKRATDIREQVFFLGVNQSFAISSCGFTMFKKNHIFFTDDYLKLPEMVSLYVGGYDLGYYNMEDGTISRYTTEMCMIAPTIICVMPNPSFHISH